MKVKALGMPGQGFMRCVSSGRMYSIVVTGSRVFICSVSRDTEPTCLAEWYLIKRHQGSFIHR